ncbi:hypothetical protein, partial [Chitinimonas sp.]|uniref:hypothetical protein n=1 Tax=Chitinimonas sp. TaxID=1934313 RepID=UPI0035B34656
MRALTMLILALALAACGTPLPPEPSLARAARDSAMAASRAGGEARWAKAQQLWQEAARRYAALDDWDNAGSALLGQAQALQAMGQAAQARAQLDALLAGVMYPARLKAEAHYQLALLDEAAGQPQQAALSLDAAQQLPGAPALQAAVLNLRARLALKAGDWQEVARFAAAALAQAQIEPGERANALRLQGRAARLLGKFDLAAPSLQQALQLDRQLARPVAILADLRELASLARQTGDPLAS